jgi:hypothetical protein
MTDHSHPVRASWKAVAWATGLNVLGVVLALGALLSTLCFMCGESDPMSGGAQLALVCGLACLVGAPSLAARSSGWPLWFLVGIGAALCSVLTLVAAAQLFQNGLVAVVLALAVQGAVAVRPPVPGAVVTRVVTIVVLAVVSVAPVGEDAAIVLPLLALPAIALADTIAASRVAPPEAAVH